MKGPLRPSAVSLFCDRRGWRERRLRQTTATARALSNCRGLLCWMRRSAAQRLACWLRRPPAEHPVYPLGWSSHLVQRADGSSASAPHKASERKASCTKSRKAPPPPSLRGTGKRAMPLPPALSTKGGGGMGRDAAPRPQEPEQDPGSPGGPEARSPGSYRRGKFQRDKSKQRPLSPGRCRPVQARGEPKT